ncbi:PREDICTED: neurogenic protein big brain [Nicrophorus vespilloides]|uniref:Neurogenic protein big brain n=1 Tax=Nicrophorus vespilloides TaxID=110193 RepID=A0ABM1N5S9_NICVS|nr:PREDICTED: neurogenic protein big brain [Nicrophorus vespilloides]
MAEESLHLPSDDNRSIDYHIVTLLDKIETMRSDNLNTKKKVKVPIQIEIRTLEFWRSVTCECLASFIYVLIVCGAAAGSGAGASLSSVLLATALSAGFCMTTLTQCFGHISGAHVNPAVSIAMGITKKISVLRACMFVLSQCGGGIAGAAFLYGVTVPGYQGNLAAAVGHTASVAAWERFGVEFILTFVIVLTYFVSMDTSRRWTNNAGITIGAAYTACTFVSMPYLNPARSLGPAFVLNKWDNHWVYWLGPSVGGAVSGIIYDYILNPRREKPTKEVSDGDSSSIHSDEDTYDDLDKPAAPKFHGSTYNTYRPTAAPPANITSAFLYPPTKLERVESLYGGTKSLCCKSPPLTRANLNRSQSVYTKSNSAINKDTSTLPRPGPLVPTQSLYPMRLNQPNQSHVQNQNVQNQMQTQRSESIYGVRGVTPGTSSRSETYASTRETERPYPSRSNSEDQKPQRPRPDSVYGIVGTQGRRGQSTASDDANYGPYHSTNQRNTASANAPYNASNNYPSKPGTNPTYATRQEVRQSPQNQPLAQASNPPPNYHHTLPQHSPNPQY